MLKYVIFMRYELYKMFSDSLPTKNLKALEIFRMFTKAADSTSLKRTQKWDNLFNYGIFLTS